MNWGVKRGDRRRKTMCIETNKTFASVTVAAKFVGQNGTGMKCGGYHWKYK
jgi:hypothetical protein